MRPAPLGLTITSGVHVPRAPWASGMFRVTLWRAPAVTVKFPLRSPLVNPFTHRSPQVTLICWAGVAHTCTEMLRG